MGRGHAPQSRRMAAARMSSDFDGDRRLSSGPPARFPLRRTQSGLHVLGFSATRLCGKASARLVGRVVTAFVCGATAMPEGRILGAGDPEPGFGMETFFSTIAAIVDESPSV